MKKNIQRQFSKFLTIVLTLLLFLEQVFFGGLGTFEVYAEEATPSATIETGDSVAISNNISVTNVNDVSSNIIPIVENIESTQSGDINLDEVVSEVVSGNPTEVPDGEIVASQSAEVITTTSAEAVTGENEVVARETIVETGDATSVSSGIAATNLNLVGSNVLLSVVNILGTLEGDVVLPNVFNLSESFLSPLTNIVTTNSADVSVDTNSSSNTGLNDQIADEATSSTGIATSSASTTVLTNLTQIGDTSGYLIINNFGDWTGSVLNWSFPGSNEILGVGSYELSNTWDTTSLCDDCNDTSLSSSQEAKVTANVSARANTGENSQVADKAILSTGDATSIANNMVITNLTSVGSGYIFGIINILGAWKGNLVVPYPKLSVTVTDGLDTIKQGEGNRYLVTISNKGKARARKVKLNISSSENITFSGLKNYEITEIGAGENVVFEVDGLVSSRSQVGAIVEVMAIVSTLDVQESTSENTAQDFTEISGEENTIATSLDHRVADLDVGITTNVHDFVYVGDEVRVYISITNRSTYLAHGVSLIGDFSGGGQADIPMSWYIGDLNRGAKAKIEFTIGLAEFLDSGTYEVEAHTRSFSAAGDETNSSSTSAVFNVKNKKTIVDNLPPVALVNNSVDLADNLQGDVLGASTVNLKNRLDSRLIYLIPILLIVNLFILILRKKINVSGVKHFLILPFFVLVPLAPLPPVKPEPPLPPSFATPTAIPTPTATAFMTPTPSPTSTPTPEFTSTPNATATPQSSSSGSSSSGGGDISGFGTGGQVLGATTLAATGDDRLNFDKKVNFGGGLIDFSLPERIMVKRLGINLGITPGKIETGQWQISDTGASYLVGSGVMGQTGNVVIYGHNLPEIFGALAKIKAKDEIEIWTTGGRNLRYEVTGVSKVSAEDVSVIAPTNESILTIYTCSTKNLLERLVVRAIPLG